MTDQTKAMEVQKEEMLPTEGTERTRETRCFIPRADIYETEEAMFVKVDMPGVGAEDIEITLEKNVLTINGTVDSELPEGFSLASAEYAIGDYERSFRISNAIDREKIKAEIKHGVLTLELQKAAIAKSQKIKVKSA
ncbi:MAG: Hsp20/alpha crystallin family protein [Anaerolineales bacterium]|nr:Hsp20/alpha crystallin family protein [Anaerolineales bacterium]